jgi:hypothetical protein
MKSRSVIFVVLGVLLVGAIYISSFPFQVFVEGAIVGGVTCTPQGGGKTYCCASVNDEGDFGGVYTTYCTTCDDTNPPSNCTKREKPMVVVNPGKVLSNILEGGVLGEATTLPEVSVLEAQRANITILPGGILQEANTSSNDSSSGILGMEQSDLVSDETKNATGTVNEEEQEESGPSKEQAREGADETDDKENIDEELPLE